MKTVCANCNCMKTSRYCSNCGISEKYTLRNFMYDCLIAGVLVLLIPVYFYVFLCTAFVFYQIENKRVE